MAGSSQIASAVHPVTCITGNSELSGVYCWFNVQDVAGINGPDGGGETPAMPAPQRSLLSTPSPHARPVLPASGPAPSVAAGGGISYSVAAEPRWPGGSRSAGACARKQAVDADGRREAERAACPTAAPRSYGGGACRDTESGGCGCNAAKARRSAVQAA
jgi:hypothetical protein